MNSVLLGIEQETSPRKPKALIVAQLTVDLSGTLVCVGNSPGSPS